MGEPQETKQEPRTGWGGPEIRVHFDKPFAMARTEVTRSQFAAFARASGYHVAGPCRTLWESSKNSDQHPTWENPLWPDGHQASDQEPVVCVSFPDAMAYAAWLSSRSTAHRYTLPNEAQFEYAARGGTKGPWPWAGGLAEICKYANVADTRYASATTTSTEVQCDDGFAFIAPVASYPPNGFGLYDLLGNAWEWALDCGPGKKDLRSYPRDGSALLQAPADCASRVTRGGGFMSPPWWLRVTARGGTHDPNTRINALGFRVVSNAP